MNGTTATGRVASLDVTEPMRVTVRVEEQHDADGDLVWAVTLTGRTYSQRRLDWLAKTLGCELEFVPAKELTA